MIYKYFDFIKEGSSSDGSPIYWSNQLTEIINETWIDFSSTRYTGDVYRIDFKVDNGGRYPYFSVLVKSENGKDVYILEDGIAENFIQKFRNDFYRNVEKYLPGFKKFKPKCIGDWNQLDMAIKYNV